MLSPAQAEGGAAHFCAMSNNRLILSRWYEATQS